MDVYGVGMIWNYLCFFVEHVTDMPAESSLILHVTSEGGSRGTGT